jgi:hypothetical protein
LVIQHQVVTVRFSYTQLQRWNIDGDTDIRINIRNIRDNEVDRKLRRARRKPGRSPIEVKRTFLTVLKEVNVTITTETVIEQRVDFTLSINVNDLNLSAADLNQVVALFFYLEDPNDPNSLVYRIITGYIDEDGYFVFDIPGDGWFTLILGDPPAEGDDQDGNNQDGDDQGEDEDEDGEATTPPSLSVRLSIGQATFVQNGVVRQMDAVPFVDGTTGETMLPLRIVAESMGVNVTWVAETSTVVLVQQETTVSVTIGQTVAGVRSAPRIVNGRTFVTEEFITSVLDASVTWDSVTQEIYINR